VIAAAPGYPGPPTKGLAIELPEFLEDGTHIFHAGTRIQGNTLVTSGGRVFGVTAQATDIEQARNRVYQLMEKIKFRVTAVFVPILVAEAL
jgi:Phosphoribosylamine-glycine ligase